MNIRDTHVCKVHTALAVTGLWVGLFVILLVLGLHPDNCLHNFAAVRPQVIRTGRQLRPVSRQIGCLLAEVNGDDIVEPVVVGNSCPDGESATSFKIYFGKRWQLDCDLWRTPRCLNLANAYRKILGLADYRSTLDGFNGYFNSSLYVSRVGLPIVLNTNSTDSLRSAVDTDNAVSGLRTDHLLASEFSVIPGSVGRISNMGGLLRNLGIGFVHRVPLESGENGVSDKHHKSDHFRSKLHIIEPISLFFTGLFMAWWGWWRIRFGCRLRHLWIGLGVLLPGFVVAVIGGMIFVTRIAG